METGPRSCWSPFWESSCNSRGSVLCWVKRVSSHLKLNCMDFNRHCPTVRAVGFLELWFTDPAFCLFYSKKPSTSPNIGQAGSLKILTLDMSSTMTLSRFFLLSCLMLSTLSRPDSFDCWIFYFLPGRRIVQCCSHIDAGSSQTVA